MSPPELLLYWIRERYEVLLKKKNMAPKPWSEDPVFQTTYFCNVRREDDKVTKWIREYYSPHVDHDMFEYNVLLARFLNRPESLQYVGFQPFHDPTDLLAKLEKLAEEGKTVWGNAYVITTHGIPMPKATYLCDNVLGSALEVLRACEKAGPPPTCQEWYGVLQAIEGVGSFLAAQIVADLKNTPGHQLREADDWWTFAAHGPGSVRGASWFFYGEPIGITPVTFRAALDKIRRYVDNNLEKCDCDSLEEKCSHEYKIPRFCNQDLQNCLCEFDKYMRVKNGTGRSKRSYPGT